MSYSRPYLMIIASRTQLHVERPWGKPLFSIVSYCLNSVLNVKAVVAAFNQEKALVGAFSVIVQPVVEPLDRFTQHAHLHHHSHHTSASMVIASNAFWRGSECGTAGEHGSRGMCLIGRLMAADGSNCTNTITSFIQTPSLRLNPHDNTIILRCC